MDREIPKKERQLKVVKRGAKVLAGVAIGIALLLFLKNTFQKQISINDIVLSEVSIGTIETSMTASGTVVPAFEEIITTPIPSRIVETYLKVGDSVMAGTPILKLDLHSLESDYEKLQDEYKIKHFKLDQMKINNQTYLSDLAMQIKVSSMKLSRMRAELKNELYLDSLGAGTTDKVRQAELSVSVSQLELEQMRQKLTNETEVRAADEKVQDLELSILQKNVEQMKRKLEDARICAPRAAILTYLNTQVGAQVGQGERIAVISDLAHFKIEGEIADTYADRLRIGGKAKVLGNGDIYRCSRLSFLDRGFAHPFILIESITEEVKKAEKKAYEKVIRMIAHEVNNTTAGITSTLDTVLDILEGEEMTDVKEVIQICSERCFVMSNFITRFAEVVKIPEPQLERRDLNQCVDSGRRFMEMMCADKQIRFRVSCCETALPVQLDATLFEQVLLNIVKNAIESFPDGKGEVIIRTETGAGGKPCLEIANNGLPIDRELEMMLFTPFFSTKPNGQGIGLIFIREVLMAHHCSFSLKSYPDGYTRFKIQFLGA